MQPVVIDENVPLFQRQQLERAWYAGWWARLAAALVDGLLFITAVVSLGLLARMVWRSADPSGFAAFFDAADHFVNARTETDSTGEREYFLLMGMLIGGYLLFYAVWEAGWTSSRWMAKPGQRLAGFRVVEVDGLDRVGFGRALGRCLVKIVLAFGCSGLGIVVSAFTIGISKRRQALHDMVAGTACMRASALYVRQASLPTVRPGGPFV